MHAIVCSDALTHIRTMSDDSVHCIVTSPPYYGQRKYLASGDASADAEIGRPGSRYIDDLVEVFGECRRALRDDGTMWLNIGDSYDGEKQMHCMPWRVALAMQESGWLIRQDIIWAKKSPMPESATDRCTRPHEYVFLLTKGHKYFFDAEAIKENSQSSPSGKNRRSVWVLGSTPYQGAHFATMPTTLAAMCIRAGTSESGCCPSCMTQSKRVIESSKLSRSRPRDYTKRRGDSGTGSVCANTVAGVLTRTVGWSPACECGIAVADFVPSTVMDPFAGSGTTVAVSAALGRRGIGIELCQAYVDLAKSRVEEVASGKTRITTEAVK